MPGKPGSLGSTPIVADFAVKSSAIFRQIAADFPASIEPQKPQCAGSPADRMSRRVYARGSFGEHRGRFLVAKTRSAGARPPGATRLPMRRPYGCAINQQRFRRSRKMRIIVILLSLMTLALVRLPRQSPQWLDCCAHRGRRGSRQAWGRRRTPRASWPRCRRSRCRLIAIEGW